MLNGLDDNVAAHGPDVKLGAAPEPVHFKWTLGGGSVKQSVIFLSLGLVA